MLRSPCVNIEMTFNKFDKKILAVHMQWDYCIPARGPSLEKLWFYDNLKLLVREAEVFYYDEYIKDLPRLKELLIAKAEEVNPDLIFFVPYTDQFSSETLDSLKSKWPTCAWFGDDTWRFESFSSKLAPHFTHVCTTDIFSVGKYRKLGLEPIVTQWAAQPGPMAGATAPEKYRYEVSFVGGRAPAREWLINRLAKQGIQVHCFGAGWPAGRVSFEEMDEIFHNSRINLNLSNSVSRDIRCVLSGPRSFVRYLRSNKAAEQIKARNFEIHCAGGFQLTNYVAGIERYLRIGEEAAVFTSPEDCAAQIKYYLSNEAERAAIMAAGRERALREHTYLNRLEQILGKIWG